MKTTYRIKVLVDTNVLLDYLVPARKDHSRAVDLFTLILTTTIEASFSTQSFLDAAYIAKKYPGFDAVAFRTSLNRLILHTNASYINTSDLREALMDPHPDLEDNAQIAFARSQRCDYILTNDQEMLSREVPGPLAIMTPAQFLAHCME